MNKEELKQQKTKVLNLFNHTMKKSIHDMYGVDFAKLQNTTNYLCELHTGNFTLKGLKKQYNLNPNNLNLLICDEGWKYELSVVRIHADFTKYTLPERGNIPTFYGKVSFERFRKKENCMLIVLSIPMEYCYDFSTFYKNENDRKWFSLHNTINFTPYTERFTIPRKDRNSNSKRLLLNGKRIGKIYNSTELSNYEESIDKSGYSIIDKHIKLKTKINEIKENKLKNCFNTKFNEGNTEIFNLLTSTQIELAKQIEACKDTEELYNLSQKLEKLYYVRQSYEKHIKYLANSNNSEISRYEKYNSIEQVEKQLLYLKFRTTAILEG